MVRFVENNNSLFVVVIFKLCLIFERWFVNYSFVIITIRGVVSYGEEESYNKTMTANTLQRVLENINDNSKAFDPHFVIGMKYHIHTLRCRFVIEKIYIF